MPHRNATRYLAPLALLLAVLTTFLVARSELGGDEPESASAPAATETAEKRSTAKPAAKKRGTSTSRASAGGKTYTVKPGDVLGSISEETGVPVADLLEYNGIDDAQNLSVGQKLKLEP